MLTTSKTRWRIAAVAAVAAIAAFGVAGTLGAARLRAQVAANQKSQSVPQWQIAAGGAAKFDVTSVKPDVSQRPPNTNVSLNFLDAGAPNVGFFSAVDMPLIAYLGFAYKLTPSQTEIAQQSLPKWASSERFDIEARSESHPSRDQMRLMMQALLAERFKLVAHFETRELPVFAVVLDKPGRVGPRLINFSSEAPCKSDSARVGGQSSGKYPGWLTPCGGLATSFVAGRVRLGSENIDIQQMVNLLAVTSFGALDQNRPIIDRTGLGGKFDFTLEFSPDPNGRAKTVPNFQVDASGPTFFEALKDQLGLKLTPEKGPVDVLIVDHVEEPTPN